MNKQFSGALYRTYTELDLFEMQKITEQVDKGLRLTKIDPDTIISMFNGMSIFAIYTDIDVFQQIYDQLSEIKKIKVTNLEGRATEHPYTKKFLRILRMPTASLEKDDDQDNENQSKSESEL